MKAGGSGGEEQGDNLVERYLIGANLMDSGDTYFNRVDNKAVIVRGDRPDLQLSALTGPVVGLINTGGHQPVEYLLHEVEQLGRAIDGDAPSNRRRSQGP